MGARVFTADQFVPSDDWKSDAQLLHAARRVTDQINSTWDQHPRNGSIANPETVADQIDDTCDGRGYYELLEARQQAENWGQLLSFDLDLDVLKTMSVERRRDLIGKILGRIAKDHTEGKIADSLSVNGYPTEEYAILHGLMPLEPGRFHLPEAAPDH